MNNLELLLQDMTNHSKYSFLDYANNKNEIAAVAEKARIQLPAHDLAVFKCTYAFVDRQNLNGCTLPKEEVEKALHTLVGKAVDFDHMRKRVVGHWIDASLEGDEITAYGVFFKGNFEEDYNVIKNMMEKDVLAISFEAYGNREFTGDGEYNLRDIEFSGGALLIKTNPAFPGSEVMEMAKKNERILEFAKVMTAPKEYIHFGEENKGEEKKEESMEKARLYFDVIQSVYDLLGSVLCPTCKENSLGEILMIDLEKQIVRVNCYNCGAIVKADLTPTIELIKKGKKPTAESVQSSILEEKKGEKDMSKKENAKSLNDNTQAQFTVKCNGCGTVFKSDVRGESTPCKSCGGTTTTQGVEKHGVLDKGEEKVMEQKIKDLEKELASKVAELEKANATIGELKKESDEAKVKIEDIEKVTAEKIEKAKTDATLVAERSAELGEVFSKDIDLLNDTAYENAKLKKEISEKNAEIAKLKDVDPNKKLDLSKGSADKGTDDVISKKSKKVSEYAWGEKE